LAVSPTSPILVGVNTIIHAPQKRSNSGCAEEVADPSRLLLPRFPGTQHRTWHRDRATRSEWSLSQIKHPASNDNPFEADELAAMLAERKKKQHVLGDLPLIVISRGLPEEKGPQAAQREEAHRKDQAALLTLSSAGKPIVAAKSGHHVPLDEPGVVASAIREIVRVRH
jgi:hypothetical protein